MMIYKLTCKVCGQYWESTIKEDRDCIQCMIQSSKRERTRAELFSILVKNYPIDGNNLSRVTDEIMEYLNENVVIK